MRRLIEQIAADQSDHARRSAVVVSQVHDEGVAVSEEIHGRDRGRCAELGLRKGIELQITDIRRIVIRLLETAVAGSEFPGIRVGT